MPNLSIDWYQLRNTLPNVARDHVNTIRDAMIALYRMRLEGELTEIQYSVAMSLAGTLSDAGRGSPAPARLRAEQ